MLKGQRKLSKNTNEEFHGRLNNELYPHSN